MKFKTKSGAEYTVDRAGREPGRTLHGPGLQPMPFKYLTNLYAGSAGVAFHDEGGSIIRYVGDISEVDSDPNEEVSGDEGNLVIRTQNSSYEFNQEQRIFRRLSGMNPGSDPNVLDGDWQSYERIENLAVGYSPLIVYAGPKQGKAKQLSRIRGIEGTYVDHPFGDVTIPGGD